MVDKFKGIIEIETGGQKRGFKFGLRSVSLFAEIFKVPFSKASEILVKASGKDGGDVDVDVIMKFYYSAALSYSRFYKKEEPTLDDVYDWIEDVTMEVMTEKIEQISKLPKETAPVETGQNLN